MNIRSQQKQHENVTFSAFLTLSILLLSFASSFSIFPKLKCILLSFLSSRYFYFSYSYDIANKRLLTIHFWNVFTKLEATMANVLSKNLWIIQEYELQSQSNYCLYAPWTMLMKSTRIAGSWKFPVSRL